MKVRTITAIIALIWVGMILAIGMESVVKFTTPTLVMSTGFDEGRTVFAAFSKVEGLLLLALVSCGIFGGLRRFDKLMIVGIVIALSLQVFWLFPVLSHQVDLVLRGETPPRTYEHSLYGILEFCKMAMLFALSIEILRGHPR